MTGFKQREGGGICWTTTTTNTDKWWKSVLEFIYVIC